MPIPKVIFALGLILCIHPLCGGGEHGAEIHKENGAVVGPAFRISVLLSPQFVKEVGDARSQLHLKAMVADKLSFRQDEFKELLQDEFRSDMSSQDAKKLLDKIRRLHLKIVADVELELRSLFRPRDIQRVFSVQLGLVGLVDGISDPELCDYLELQPTDLRPLHDLANEVKIAMQERASEGKPLDKKTFRKEGDATLIPLLNNRQQTLYRNAISIAADFERQNAK